MNKFDKLVWKLFLSSAATKIFFAVLHIMVLGHRLIYFSKRKFTFFECLWKYYKLWCFPCQNDKRTHLKIIVKDYFLSSTEAKIGHHFLLSEGWISSAGDVSWKAFWGPLVIGPKPVTTLLCSGRLSIITDRAPTFSSCGQLKILEAVLP